MITRPSKRSKSLMLRVTTVIRWTSAVAPMRASRNGAGSGTWSPDSWIVIDDKNIWAGGTADAQSAT